MAEFTPVLVLAWDIWITEVQGPAPKAWEPPSCTPSPGFAEQHLGCYKDVGGGPTPASGPKQGISLQGGEDATLGGECAEGLCCAKSLQLCPTLWDPKDCSLPGSSVHGILQARELEWAVISFSRGSSQPRDWTALVGGFFTTRAIPGKPQRKGNQPEIFHYCSLLSSL